MFQQFKKNSDESGLVLFIVLMTAIIIMIFSLGILTQSMNEINYAQQQIDQLAAAQWSKAVFWNEYANSFGGLPADGTTTVLGGRKYSISVLSDGNGEFNVVTNYDTFQ